MTNTNEPPCLSCKNKGWFSFNIGTHESPRYEIHRCDVCEQYPGDLAALEAMEKAALAQPALLRFVQKLADLKHESGPDDDGPFERSSEDSIAALNQFILEARQLLGTADKCVGYARPFRIP